MPSRCTDPAASRRRRRLLDLVSEERGQIVVETSLLMFVLMFFMLLAPALWTIWMAEQRARSEAHRGVFYKLTLPIELPSIPSLHIPFKPSHKIPTLGPEPPKDLAGYKDFPGGYVEGWKYVKEPYTSGSELFQGEAELARYGTALRTPWAWVGWPRVPTQEFHSGDNKMQKWFKEAYAATLDDKMIKALKLSKKPL